MSQNDEYRKKRRLEGKFKEADKKYYEKNSQKRIERNKQFAKDHPQYRRWLAMIQRCTNPNEPAYINYGGRGIKVCDRWRVFKNFEEDINKLLGPIPQGNYSIDRINNNGNYEPGNVRWADSKTQLANRRISKRR